jgi:hypothetical protein
LPPRQPPSHRDVYALGDERNRVKIGISNDIRKRMSDLQTGTADNLRLIHSEKAERSIATKVERGARKMLSDAGKTGVREWRNDVSDDEARDAIRVAHDNERGRNRK